jgi:hypothetical protein
VHIITSMWPQLRLLLTFVLDLVQMNVSETNVALTFYSFFYDSGQFAALILALL